MTVGYKIGYQIMYRLGITPWVNGEPPEPLAALIEGPRPLPPGPSQEMRAKLPVIVEEPSPPPLPVEIPPLLKLRDQALATEGNLPAPPAAKSLVPSKPPLRAFGTPPSALLH